MMFFFHISTRACFKKNVTAKRLCASWCLCVLAKPCISPVAVEGQALWSTESSLRATLPSLCAAHICQFRAECVDTNQTPETYSWYLKHVPPRCRLSALYNVFRLDLETCWGWLGKQCLGNTDRNGGTHVLGFKSQCL